MSRRRSPDSQRTHKFSTCLTTSSHVPSVSSRDRSSGRTSPCLCSAHEGCLSLFQTHLQIASPLQALSVSRHWLIPSLCQLGDISIVNIAANLCTGQVSHKMPFPCYFAEITAEERNAANSYLLGSLWNMKVATVRGDSGHLWWSPQISHQASRSLLSFSDGHQGTKVDSVSLSVLNRS